MGWAKNANTAIEGMFDNNPYMAENLGGAVQGAVGAYGMFANIANTAKEAGNVQYDLGGLMDTNPYERPTYDLGNAWAENAAFDPGQAGKGLIGESIMSGIGAGSSIGSVGGPIGTGIGAIAGAVTGLVGGLFGKKKARKNAEEAKARELAELRGVQDEYNVEAQSYDSNMDARDSYNKRLQNRRRNINKVLG
jgi:hypothetical protein